MLTPRMNEQINVLIVDDSTSARTMLRRIVEGEAAAEIGQAVGQVAGGSLLMCLPTGFRVVL